MKIENLKLKIIPVLKSNLLFFLITTLTILALNLTPLILQYRHTPAGRTFGLINNNVQDFYFYQALMNEGGNGAILTYDPYTSEPHQPSIIFSYFLWLGKLSKILGLPYAITYHATRIILGFLFLLATFYLLLFLKVPYPRLTYLFFLFAAPFMHTIDNYGVLQSVPYMAWWNGVDPIRRAAFLPHHMLGGLLLILSIMLIFKYMQTPSRAALARLILLSIIMAFVHTPSLLILLLVLPLAVIISYFIKQPKIPISKTELYPTNDRSFLGLDTWRDAFTWVKGKDGNRKRMEVSEKFGIEGARLGLIIYWLAGLFFLVAMVLQTKSGFPWSQYIDWEKNLQFPLERELIGALGILLPFSIVGAIAAVNSKKFQNIFIACWLFIPFLFIPIAPKLNLSNIRLIQGIPYLPLAILAIYGIKAIEKLFRKFQNLFVYLLIGLFVYFTLPTLKWSLKDQIREYMPIYGNVYLDNRLFAAFDFVNNNFPDKTITLCTFYCGNYLPVYTHTVSFIGHFGYTYNEAEKEKETQRFFEGKMTNDEAKNFLLSNKIALIFQGPEEKPLYNNYLYPTLLKPVYDKEEATLYTCNF